MNPAQLPSMTSMLNQQQPPAGGQPNPFAQPQQGGAQAQQSHYHQSYQQPQAPPQPQPQYPTLQQRAPAVNLPQGQPPYNAGGQSPQAPAQGAPFGGVTPPPAGPGPAGGVSSNQYVQLLESQNRIPKGRFTNDQELIEGLYEVADDLASQLDARQTQNPGQPSPATGSPPAGANPPAYTPPGQIPPATAGEVNYSDVVPVFQSQGWLTMQNGQWVAANPIANDAASFLNRRIAQSQVLQAELSANPNGFFQKYGADAIKQQLTPLEQQIAQMKEENQRIQQQLQGLAPQPHRDWVAQNEALLYAPDQNGQKVPTQAGAAYRDAWSLAQNGGVQDAATLHQIALMAVQPYLKAAPSQTPPPSWAQTVAAQTRPYDPSFTAPGSQAPQGNQGPSYGGIPVTNSGFPSFAALTAYANQTGV